MEIGNLNKKTSNVANEVRFLRLTTLLLAILMIIIMLYSIIRGSESTVEVNVPPNLTQSFWVKTHGDFDHKYLEQMGTFISYLILNATPESVSFQADILKPYLSPKAYGKFITDAEAKKEHLKKYQISTAFHPQQIFLSKSGQCRVQVKGMLQTFVGSTPSTNKSKLLNIDCENINGRFYVTGIAINNAE